MYSRILFDIISSLDGLSFIIKEKLYFKSGNEFGILSIEFWIKHYQLDLGKM